MRPHAHMISTASVCIAVASACLAVVAPVANAQSSSAATTAKPDAEAFDILEFVVEGNSVLPNREIERALYRFMGPQRRFAELEAARKSLEETYQRLGYQTVFVEIPEQRVADGVVRLRVIEGRVDRTRVTGSRYFSLGEIRTRVPELASGTVPDFNVVQEQLSQLNRTPDLQVAPVLRPGATPGTVDVDLSVKDSLPLHADLELNNRSSPFTTDLRLNGLLRYDNLWQRQHSLSLNWQVSPEDRSEVDVLFATYLWRFSDSTDLVSVYAVKSDSSVAIVGGATVLGAANIAGARWIHPLQSSAGMFHTLTFGLDYKDFGQTNISSGAGTTDILPPIRYVPLSIAYGLSRFSRSDSLQLNFTVATAPRGLFGNDDESFQSRRVNSNASWFWWRYDASYERWFGSRWSAFARVSGQLTGTPLIPNEQLAMGGLDTVRGYREAELAADRVVQGTVEARWHAFGRPQPGAARFAYLGLFVEGAALKSVEPLGPQLKSAQLSATGLSLRAGGWRGLRIGGDYARVFKSGATSTSTPSGYVTPRGEDRVLFSVGGGF